MTIIDLIKRKLRLASLGFKFSIFEDREGRQTLLVYIPREISIVNNKFTDSHVLDIGNDPELTKESLRDKSFQRTAYENHSDILDKEKTGTILICNRFVVGYIGSCPNGRIIEPLIIDKDAPPSSEFDYRSIIPENVISETPSIDDVIYDILDLINDSRSMVTKDLDSKISTENFNTIKINYCDKVDRDKSVQLYKNEYMRLIGGIILYEGGI